jgi:hypothetical protein
MYSASVRPVRYADRSAVCVDYPTAWSDHPVMYSDCLALCTDGLNCSFKVCAECGGSGVDLGNSVLKMGPTTIGTDGGWSDRAQTGKFTPDIRRRLWLSLVCVYQHPVKGL